MEFDYIFFWNLVFDEIWIIATFSDLDGTSTHEVEFDTVIYEFNWII
jgi:hypothetical protein